MLRIFFIILSACVSTAAVLTPSMLNHTWTQVYSTYYIQSSSEIDWKCVKAFITVSNSTIAIKKKALLHGLLRSYVYNNAVYNITGVVENRIMLQNEKDKAIILCQADTDRPEYCIFSTPLSTQLSSFVIARDYNIFMSQYAEEVNDILTSSNMSGIYKTLVPSYTNICI